MTLDQACEFLYHMLVSVEDGDVLVPELNSCLRTYSLLSSEHLCVPTLSSE
ncbi:MAG: hypothetical protein JSW03_05750 [Candidatus Eiseniibacteriota bacterium]|nr:MAG: hypothetical protein JSW03_05750 [Candidatus Eisenbacteria bacterium]